MRELAKSLRADERCNFLCPRLVGLSERASCSTDHDPERVHMKKLILFAGVAAFAVGAPALAQHGNSHGKQDKAQSAKWNGGEGHAKWDRRHIMTTRSGNGVYAFNARGRCPPGLARKNNGCLPPGQARKMYDVGQRYNRNFGTVWTYNQIPRDLRSRYDFDQNDRYYYRNGYLYQVDPKTMLVQQVISALLR
jgi:hypothetical protein